MDVSLLELGIKRIETIAIENQSMALLFLVEDFPNFLKRVSKTDGRNSPIMKQIEDAKKMRMSSPSIWFCSLSLFEEYAYFGVFSTI